MRQVMNPKRHDVNRKEMVARQPIARSPLKVESSILRRLSSGDASYDDMAPKRKDKSALKSLVMSVPNQNCVGSRSGNHIAG